ncbi:phosphatidylcholine:ceramide cholinephosphotransferase 1-like isoform X2 [Wyeomyia smithii]|uniref:phosphatidylcholine:ceramide cholinephosphotransferase 1-like isoform X2 n=1 Tax=Wyeomyia smithii TaxID=174621 RepID=UPI002467C9C2|nr:phosphatidylcholine:ceramide cholinephosphotransferase 1-like isoform X2 [Wyeomyia smithii]XP_055548653.1 phosphatidylcholine:ceramide cholinephosphotransferase 1-like isoform X2 [Wyeomyia smithii]
MSTNYVQKVKKGINKVIYDKLYINCSTFRKMHYEEVPDGYDYAYNSNHSYHQQHPQSDDCRGSPCSDAVMIKVDVPVPVRDEQRYPKEICKTLLALFIMTCNFILATVSLSIVHDRVPDRDSYGPLPDVVLDNIMPVEWALDVSEILIMVVVNSCVLLITFHKHRFIVMRRVFLIMSILYFMRSITMYVTVLPVSSVTYYCSPRANVTPTPQVIVKRAFQLISGFGLSINGKHTYCGDYIYSGHTVTLVMGYLIIAEYSPKRFWIIHWIAWCVSSTGVTMVLLAHGHYTIDVLIAYYVTTRLFWTYHTLANNSLLLKQNGHNYIGREWWFFIFRYFERNVRGPVPLQYNFPFPIPWTKKAPKLASRES